MANKKIATHRWSQGFSLLEVLIAVLVIAIGLLGMAALQLKTVQNSHSAFQRTLASVIAMDASERLWINLGDAPTKTAATIQTEWLTAWNGVLPAAATASSIEDLGGGKWRISVRWQENRLADTNAVETFVYEMDLYP
jgi:type IV pilus assembly protein PilV